MTILLYLMDMKKKSAPLPRIFAPSAIISPDFPASIDHETYKNYKGKSNVFVPHVHQMLEIGFIHEGHGSFVIAEKHLEFKTGDIIILTTAEPHMAFFPVTCICSWL
jgi:hypothetical protein